jgi:hypothetical protein
MVISYVILFTVIFLIGFLVGWKSNKSYISFKDNVEKDLWK